VLSINDAFEGCPLTGIVIPAGVTNCDNAFSQCEGLTSILFEGNAPLPLDPTSFYLDNYLTVYYLPGTAGWGPFYCNRPALLWDASPSAPALAPDGFGFAVTGNTSLAGIVVEATSDLANPTWVPVGTNAPGTTFTDTQWTNYPARFYRVRP
jgi:hypothetical protein